MENTQPEILDELTEQPDDEATSALAEVPDQSESEAITEPGKLMRMASMARAMLVEARSAPIDEAGRDHLKQIYDRTVSELRSVLPDALREELSTIFVPLDGGVPSESELRLAQAQMVGWLEGLFNGIQAAVMTQQMAAQAQLMRMQDNVVEEPAGPGQYL
jgi:hypothetical protein